MSNLQQNIESNQIMNKFNYNQNINYSQQSGNYEEIENNNINQYSGEVYIINNYNNKNQEYNDNSSDKSNSEQNNKFEPSSEKKKKYITDLESKGVYKRNIIKRNLNNKSNKSNQSGNNSGNSGTNSKAKLGQIKVHTYGWKKNINRNNVLNNIKQNQIMQNNPNQVEPQENKINLINNQFNNMNQNNIQLSNIQINNINYNNNEPNPSFIGQKIISNQCNNNQFDFSGNNQFKKDNEFQSNISQKITSQSFKSNINQNNMNFVNVNKYSQNQFNIQSNISQNSFNIKNNNIINSQNNQNLNFMSQSQSQNNNFNQNTFEILQNNNQINVQLNSAVEKKINNKKSNVYNFSRYKRAAMTGLKNLGNTSFFNAVLQLLCSIRNFSSYFLNPKNGAYFLNDIEKYSLSFVFHRLCIHLYPYPEKRGRELYKPDSFFFILGKSNIVYKDNEEEKNPNMLIVYLLNKLHEELNTDKNNGNNFSDINMNIATNRDATINNGIQNFIKNNKSIIFNYFNWFEIKETKCMRCNNELFSLRNFSTFELDIFGCARYKKLQLVKLEDCLNFYNTTKIKKNFCHFCKEYKEATISTQIYSSPNIFIFLLNLENKDRENADVNFILEKHINLGNFIENKIGPSKYDLNEIVFLNKIKKKYISLCLSPVDNRWYLYDDEKVELTDYDNFIQQENNNTLNYQPFILLYKNSRN
jgi:ubiquitin C-terminal hydrolase